MRARHRSARRALVTALTCCVVGLGASPAGAGTVGLEGDTVTFKGDDEDNHVELIFTLREGQPHVVVLDAAVQPEAASPCRRDDVSTYGVICPDAGGATIQHYVVDLGPGDDRLEVAAGFSSGVAIGGPGEDELIGSERTFPGFPGEDAFDGGSGPDQLEGGAGDDLLHGGTSDDSVSGGAGDDDVQGGEDKDRIEGGAGADALLGGSEPDLIRGDAGPDEVLGEQGDDTLLGGPGNDVVDGGTGNDQLEDDGLAMIPDPGFGSDVLRGGPDGDVAYYEGRPQGVAVTLDGLPDDGMAGEGDNVSADVESIVGSHYGDVLVGNDAGQSFDGGLGDDVIRAGGGDDDVDGGFGDDQLYGEAGADRIRGEGDGDLLDGGPGIDALSGDSTCSLDWCEGGPDEIRASDGEAEFILCGAGFDRAIVDEHDRVSVGFLEGCETVERLTMASPPASMPPVISPPASAADPLTITGRSSLRALLRRGLRLHYACPNGCAVHAQLVYKRKRVASGRSLARASSVTLKANANGRKRLRRLRRAKLTLTVNVTDVAGRRSSLRRTLKFTR